MRDRNMCVALWRLLRGHHDQPVGPRFGAPRLARPPQHLAHGSGVAIGFVTLEFFGHRVETDDRVDAPVSQPDAVMVVDSGLVINPAVVEGQHQGGFAQGLGNVFHEEVVYSEDGQPLCSTLVDYTIPTASESVALRIVHRETPSEVLGGVRGAGEAAITAAPAVLAGAVEDALAPLGVRINSTRLSADALWRSIVEASREPVLA